MFEKSKRSSLLPLYNLWMIPETFVREGIRFRIASSDPSSVVFPQLSPPHPLRSNMCENMWSSLSPLYSFWIIPKTLWKGVRSFRSVSSNDCSHTFFFDSRNPCLCYQSSVSPSPHLHRSHFEKKSETTFCRHDIGWLVKYVYHTEPWLARIACPHTCILGVRNFSSGILNSFPVNCCTEHFKSGF